MPSPRVRLVAALAVLAATTTVLLVQVARGLDNTDTYFHLRFGREFLDGSWSLGHPGSPSTFGTADWVPTQWLIEVVMAQLEAWFGLAGVAWLAGLLLTGLLLTLYAACRRRADPLVAAGVVALALVASSSGISMRPQVVSYALVTVTVVTWQRALERRRAPWVLVPMTWVWSLCHGMWPIGIVLGLAFILGVALDRALPRPVVLRMAAVPVLSALATMVTPVGPGLFPAVLRVTGRARYFDEWGPPVYTRPYVAVLLLLLALAVVPLLRRGRAVPWSEVALLGVAGLCAAYSMRTVPVAACLVGPLAAAAVQPVLGERARVTRGERLSLLGGFATALVALALVVPHTADRPRDQPVWLDDELAAAPAGTVVLDDQGLGGYLLWRFPQLDLVTHGYGDTFTDAELERNADIGAVRGGWVELVRDTRARYAVLRPGSPLAYSLRDVERWDVVETRDDWQLLVPPPGWYDD